MTTIRAIFRAIVNRSFASISTNPYNLQREGITVIKRGNGNVPVLVKAVCVVEYVDI
jgi:hypothetical protein